MTASGFLRCSDPYNCNARRRRNLTGLNFFALVGVTFDRIRLDCFGLKTAYCTYARARDRMLSEKPAGSPVNLPEG